MPRARFLGTGFAVPDRVVTNDDLSQLMDTSDEWIRTRTGIQERRWVREGETGAELALAATPRALETAGLDAGATSTRSCTPPRRPTTSRPATASTSSGCWASAPSPPSTSGPSAAASSTRSRWRTRGSGAASTATCWWSGAEVQSTALDVSTRGRNTAVIFADGAGAAVLGPERRRARHPRLRPPRRREPRREALGGCARARCTTRACRPSRSRQGRHFLEMDGKEVFRHAVARMPESVRAVLAATGHDPGRSRACWWPTRPTCASPR